jgi:vancomycin resistance protein YoaR
MTRSTRPPRRPALLGSLLTAVLVAGLFATAAPVRAEEPPTDPQATPSPAATSAPTATPLPVPVGTPEEQVARMTAAPLMVVGPDTFAVQVEIETLAAWVTVGPTVPAATPTPDPLAEPTPTPDPLAEPTPTPLPTTDPAATQVSIDRQAIVVWLTDYLSRYAVPGRNAAWRMDSKGKFTKVVPSKDGRGLIRSASARTIIDALWRRAALDWSNDLGSLVVGPVKPALSTEKATEMMPKLRRISAWTTYWQVGENNGFGANIIIPAKKINTTIIMPGETFDFWKVVGTPTAAQGYKAGGAIINGKSEPTGAFAGGICSTSTTIFNAALRAGFPILSRVPHYYYIDRYPLGLDATVWIDGGSRQSVMWRNDSTAPVYIRAIAKPGIVTFELYSVPLGRKVSFSKPKVSGRVAAADYREYTSSLPAGAAKRLEFPHPGMYVEVTRTVTDKAGTVLHKEVWKSRYKKVDGRVLVGRSSAPPTVTPSPPPGSIGGGGPGPSAQ